MLCVKFVKQKKSNNVFGVNARTTFLQSFNICHKEEMIRQITMESQIFRCSPYKEENVIFLKVL